VLQLLLEPRRRRVAVLEDDERLRLDEPVRVLVPDDGGFEHGLVADPRVLDLDRRDPDAADLEHVVGPAAVQEVGGAARDTSAKAGFELPNRDCAGAAC